MTITWVHTNTLVLFNWPLYLFISVLNWTLLQFTVYLPMD